MRRVVSIILVLIVSTWCQAEPISGVIQKRLAMGDKPNRLIHEKSPYLLQHAFNPVEWYPWGDDAFARAKAENKPIFLSVGYSTCHWCHVMEEESFENPEIAAILNRWFICIKVDREERPDIDQLYMAATQAMTGSGGWPMSVFLFPDGKPFYAGTYFPPAAKYGRPGFDDVLHAIHDAWQNKNSDLAKVANELVDALARNAKSLESTKVAHGILDAAFEAFAKDYEPGFGGFSHAPKFPRPVQFNFLLSHWYHTGNERALSMVRSTLKHMADGGIYDHIGGGFHRYATDTKWRVPHFEKMLYDQSQLASSYLDAYIITKDQEFADVAADVLSYVQSSMTAPEGGFYSAEDADSEDPYKPGTHGEGAFYLWTAKEIEEILSSREAAIFSYCFGVQKNGNVPEDPMGEFTGKNILYIAHSDKEAAEKFKIPVAEIQTVLEKAKELLKNRRSLRNKPHLDDKVLVSWNGLMIGALARGGIILDNPQYIESAVHAATFIRNSLYNEEKRSLMRRYRQGTSGLAAQLDDFTYLVAGLIELYQATQKPEWLKWAIELTEEQIRIFWDREQGGFFDSVIDKTLPVRMKGDYDGAEPSANSIAANNLFILGTLTANNKWLEMGNRNIEVFGSMLNAQPKALPQLLYVLQSSRSKPRQVIIAGSPGDSATEQMIQAAYMSYAPGRTVLLADNEVNQQFLTGYLPFIEGMVMKENLATAYVCQDFSCQMPVNSLETLQKKLTQK